MDDRDWQKLLERNEDTNKYDYGHVLIVGGSAGMAGAPLLAGRAALRIGAGLVTIASTAEVIERIGVEAEEIMTTTVLNWDESAVGMITEFIKRRHVTVVVIGPGLSEDSFAAVRKLVGACTLPIVVDAGGLAAFGGHQADLRQASAKNNSIIMTPHTGEYTTLGGNEQPADFARRNGVTLVLKSHQTMVCGREGATYQNHTGNPGLATAGTGDVLTGVIAGLLGQGFDAFRAATMAVYLHGLAGDRAAEKMTEPGVIASDVIEAIPDALHQIALK